MFNAEIRKLLIQVITSWQVIAVTVVLVIYIFIVNYVGRLYQGGPKRSFLPKPRKSPKEETPEAIGPSEGGDELGLEDDTKKG